MDFKKRHKLPIFHSNLVTYLNSFQVQIQIIIYEKAEYNVIFSFWTGMEEASCEKAAFVSTYQENTDAFAVIQGPAARIRPTHLPEDYFSCEFMLITPDFPPSQRCSITQCRFVCNQCGWPCPVFLSLSRLWRPGEEPVGMQTILNVTLVLTRRMKNYLLA